MSYSDLDLTALRVAHCGNDACSSGNIIKQPAGGTQLRYSSLELDALGKPVISYYANGDLNVMHCNDVNCDPLVPGGPVTGAESIASPDPAGATANVGLYTSLELDSAGNPVVSYYDATNDDIKVIHCGNPNCTVPKPPTITPTPTDTPIPPTPTATHTFPPPTATPTNTLVPPTATPTITPTTTKQPEPFDTDLDGCSDQREYQTAAGSETSGGRRNFKNFWDFFDTPDGNNARDRAVAGTDFFRVIARFGSSGSASIDPLSAPPAAPAYHTAFDRGAASGDPWDLTAANGSIAGTDFFAMLVQFGHTCA